MAAARKQADILTLYICYLFLFLAKACYSSYMPARKSNASVISRAMPKIISANRLADGTVVYAAPDGSWPTALEAARIFESEAEARDGLRAAHADAKRNLILDPFIVEIVREDGGLRAARLRDAIRARGPTFDFTPWTSAQPARSERS